MVRVLLAGVHRVRKRLKDGTAVEYHYAWRGGPQIWRTGADYAPGHATYLASCRTPAARRSTLRAYSAR